MVAALRSGNLAADHFGAAAVGVSWTMIGHIAARAGSDAARPPEAGECLWRRPRRTGCQPFSRMPIPTAVAIQ